MPEIEREKLDAKLNTIPEADREGYVQALKSKGYTWKSNAPPASSGIGAAVSGAADLLTGGELGSKPQGMSPEVSSRYDVAKSAIANTPLMRALGFVGSTGKALNEKAQESASKTAEISGQIGAEQTAKGRPALGAAITGAGLGSAAALGIGSEAVLPKDKISAAATLAGLAPMESAEAQAGYKIPTKAQRTIAEVAGTQSGVNPKHLAAVIANPEIMGDATPSMAEVGKKYQELFKRLGETVDSDAYKEITGMRYKPTDTQVSKLQGIVSQTMDKLDKGEEVSAAEAFLARSAAKKAMMNGATADVAGLARDSAALDDYLATYKNIPELKGLGHEYFRAAAKESLSDVLPKNKRGDPAVVRSLLMANYGKNAMANLAEGKPVKAAINAGTAAAMSPLVQGKVIPFLTTPTSPMAIRAATIGAGQTPAQIQALLRKRQKDQENGQ